MTLSEFKAWFEGYTEGLEAAPTKAQFDRIKEKVKEIDGAPVTQTVFLSHYWRPYQLYNQPPYWNGSYAGVAMGQAPLTVGNAQYANQVALASGGNAVNEFDSHAAMYAAGKAEAVN